MSEKRSWDIQPNRKAPTPAPRVVARPQSVPRANRTVSSRPPRQEPPSRRPTPPKQTPQVQPPRRKKIPQGKDREPLKNQRRRARRRASLTMFLSLVLLIVGIGVCLWLPLFRIQTIQVAGPDADGMKVIALTTMVGTDKYIFPRNSIFYFPENQIRMKIIAQYPDISAVAISRSSLHSIALDSIPRETAFIWCGPTYNPIATNPSTLATTESTTTDGTGTGLNGTAAATACYNADSQGVVFSPVADPSVVSGETLRVYGALTLSAANTGNSPLGSSIAQASMLPNALEFVKVIKSLGVPIVSLVLRGDEADLHAQSGTRITYVVGKEAVAENLAESAFGSLSLNDGSLEYVDLRFDGKVYFKKVGSEIQTATASTTAH